MTRWVRRVLMLLIAVAAAVAVPVSTLAQSPEPSPGTDVFGNMPGIVFLLIPLAIIGAIYLSRELGRTDEDTTPNRRQGAVSKALARQKEEVSNTLSKGKS